MTTKKQRNRHNMEFTFHMHLDERISKAICELYKTEKFLDVDPYRIAMDGPTRFLKAKGVGKKSLRRLAVALHKAEVVVYGLKWEQGKGVIKPLEERDGTWDF